MNRRSIRPLAVAFAAFCAVLATALPSAADSTGRGAVHVDTVGIPVSWLRTPMLEPGRWYEFQTFDLRPTETTVFFVDTVMSIRTTNLVDGSTVAGADGCSTPGAASEIMRSCVRFYVNPSRYPTARSFWIWVRTWDTTTSGKASVRMQELTSPLGPPGTGSCGASADAGCWRLLSNDVDVGGLIVRDSELGEGLSGPVQFETTDLPGGGDIRPSILFAGQNDDVNANWRIRSNGDRLPSGFIPGGPGSHPRKVHLHAQWSGYGAEVGLHDEAGYATVIGAPFPAYGGPYRLLRNDRVTIDRGQQG